MEERRQGFLCQSMAAVLLNKRLIIRAVFSVVLVAYMVYLVHLLFFHAPADSMKDMINVMLGAVLMAFSKVVDFWFRRDDEDKKTDGMDPTE